MKNVLTPQDVSSIPPVRRPQIMPRFDLQMWQLLDKGLYLERNHATEDWLALRAAKDNGEL